MTSTPRLRRPAAFPPALWLLATLAISGPALAGAPETDALGPPVAFERRGATVCASYQLGSDHALYHDRISARQGASTLLLQGLPAGVAKSIAGVAELVMGASFKACATGPSASAPIEWVDQSCLATQGVCLPPRAFSVDERGKAAPLPGERAASLFALSMRPASTKPAADSWSFGFAPKK